MILKKQNSCAFILCFMLACAQNIDAMCCKIKSLGLMRKVQYFKALSFCNNSEKSDDDLKKLQQTDGSFKNIQLTCLDAIEKNNVCKSKNSCCLVAKKDAQQAEKRIVARLKKSVLCMIKDLSILDE